MKGYKSQFDQELDKIYLIGCGLIATEVVLGLGFIAGAAFLVKWVFGL